MSDNIEPIYITLAEGQVAEYFTTSAQYLNKSNSEIYSLLDEWALTHLDEKLKGKHDSF